MAVMPFRTTGVAPLHHCLVGGGAPVIRKYATTAQFRWFEGLIYQARRDRIMLGEWIAFPYAVDSEEASTPKKPVRLLVQEMGWTTC